MDLRKLLNTRRLFKYIQAPTLEYDAAKYICLPRSNLLHLESLENNISKSLFHKETISI